MNIKKIIREELDWIEDINDDLYGTIFNFPNGLTLDTFKEKVAPQLTDIGIDVGSNEFSEALDEDYENGLIHFIFIFPLEIRADKDIEPEYMLGAPTLNYVLKNSNSWYRQFGFDKDKIIDGDEFFDLTKPLKEDFDWVEDIPEGEGVTEELLMDLLKNNSVEFEVSGLIVHRYRMTDDKSILKHIPNTTNHDHEIIVYWKDNYKISTISYESYRATSYKLEDIVDNFNNYSNWKIIGVVPKNELPTKNYDKY